nr:HK97 family phage prohead protease [Allomuricauda sp.]
MDKDYIKDIEGAERRYFKSSVLIEKRTEGEADSAPVIEGYAALFNNPTELFWFREEILPGAFDNVLGNDVRCLFNHDPNQVLARSVDGQGTLELSVDSTGLKYRYTTPDRSFARDLADAIEKGDVTQSSFSFRAKKVIWTEGEQGEMDLRQIAEVDVLYDVAPVTYPAYADTSVAKRSRDAMSEEKNNENELDEFDALYMYNKNRS